MPLQVDTCKSLCKAHLHIDFICVLLHCFTLLAACQKASVKVSNAHAACNRKKGMFDEAVQTQANCIIQWVKNMHLEPGIQDNNNIIE